MNSYEYRNNPMFLRNQFETQGKKQFPYIRKQPVNLDKIELIAFSATKLNDTQENRMKIAHGFLDDYRMNVHYNNPDKHKARLCQYRALISPDYSDYREMNTWREIEAIGHNRWVGKHWQDDWQMTVIPSITWSGPASFEFCFDGVERHCFVAISTVGTQLSKKSYMLGYDAMLEHIAPDAVICLGKAFSEMRGDVISVPYDYPRKKPSQQLSLPFYYETEVSITV